jgi:cyanophycinase
MLHRRQLLNLTAASALASWPFASASAQTRKVGRLLAIGGAEDRQQDPIILRRFVELCGGASARILVMTAASGVPDASWAGYEPVFKGLGATHCEPLDMRSPEDANRPDVVDRILSADGIFMSGGDQRRLMSTLWETEAFRAMHIAFHVRGCCIAGTSAGAAALSRQMLAVGDTPVLPQKEAVSLDIGLGFVSHAIIDQHFSQRRRLGRLLSALAQRPDMLGVGIDEDTALLIERGQAIEVIGKGAVTLVDGREMDSNFLEAEAEQRLEMLNVKLHLLPSGRRYQVLSRHKTLPTPLHDVVELLVKPGPIRG